MNALRNRVAVGGRVGAPRRALALLGDAVLSPLLGAWTLSSVGTAVLVQGIKPGAWRRTVRAEFVRHCGEMGIAALPAVSLVGALVGLGLVLQALFWLGLFGQSDIVGKLLVLILVRELGPLLVGLLLVGRSATVIITELHELVVSGGLRSLDAMGIDPFHYLVLPRVFAMTVSCFCLNVVFLGAALVIGHLGASISGLSAVSFSDFLHDVFGNMGVSEFVITALKPLLFGFSVALISCTLALLSPARSQASRQLLPRGFVASMTAVLLISVTLSALL